MKRKEVLIILGSIFIFVIVWIGFTIYHNSIKSTISESTSMQISPISPNFDTSVINKLKQRQVVTPVYQTTAGDQTSSTTETLVIAPPVISSGSATQATSGGSLLQ
jgi:hypothetical protein